MFLLGAGGDQNRPKSGVDEGKEETGLLMLKSFYLMKVIGKGAEN